MVGGMNHALHFHLGFESRPHPIDWRKTLKAPNTLIHNLPLIELGVGCSLLPLQPGFPYAQMAFSSH
jgi:hypothetical protein